VAPDSDIAALTAHGITTISQLNEVVDAVNNKFDQPANRVTV